MSVSDKYVEPRENTHFRDLDCNLTAISSFFGEIATCLCWDRKWECVGSSLLHSGIILKSITQVHRPTAHSVLHFVLGNKQQNRTMKLN